MAEKGKRYRKSTGNNTGVSSEIKRRNRKIAAAVVVVFLAAAALYTMVSLVKPGSYSLVMEPGVERKIGGDYSSWKTSDPSVVEVDQKGTLTARKVGKATVTARGSWGKSHQWQVSVCAINKKNLLLAPGGTAQLKMEGAEDLRVRWESADNRLVKVDQNGLVTAVKAGSALVFCHIDDYELKCRVNIPCLARESLLLSPQGYAKIRVLNSGDEEIHYSSEDESVAEVSKDGVVSGVEVGNTRINCRLGDLVLVQEVEVTEMDISSLTITPGQSFTVRVEGISGGEWSSEDPSVASVDNNGSVTGRKVGQTRIKVTTEGSVFITLVNVAALEETDVTVSLDEESYEPEVVGSDESIQVSVENTSVAEAAQGKVLLKAVGDTVVHVSCGEALMDFTLHVTGPKNVVTKMSDLPQKTRKARVTVTIHSYPSDKTYMVFNQADGKNKTRMFPHYMPAHGCAACSTAVVLTGYGHPMTPAEMVENVERSVLGSKWKNNYSKDHKHRMPMTLYGITKVLDHYKIASNYVRNFKDAEAMEEILEHLKTGRPVIFEVKNYDRYRKKKSTRWANSYHTMVFLGLTDTGKVIVADPANRSSKTFGTMGRLKYVDIKEVIPYMFSCTSNKKHCYFSSGSTAGGYILVD